MNNDITLRPAYLGETRREDAFSDTLGFAQPARISMDSGFNVLDENGMRILPTSLTLDVIMLWENDTRVYYPPDSYDSSRPTPPTCFSDDKVRPSPNAIEPQSELCANCPRAVWDQKTPKGNLVPACDNRYKVAVLVAGTKGTIFLLSVAPASRRPYENYRRYLKVNHAQPNDVVTRLGYENKALTFSFNAWVSPDLLPFVQRALETDEPKMIVGRTAPLSALPPRPTVHRVIAEAGPTQLAYVPPVTETSPAVPLETPKRGPGRPRKSQGEPQGFKEATFVGSGPIGQETFASPAAPSTPAPASSEDIQAALDKAFGFK